MQAYMAGESFLAIKQSFNLHVRPHFFSSIPALMGGLGVSIYRQWKNWYKDSGHKFSRIVFLLIKCIILLPINGIYSFSVEGTLNNVLYPCTCSSAMEKEFPLEENSRRPQSATCHMAVVDKCTLLIKVSVLMARVLLRPHTCTHTYYYARTHARTSTKTPVSFSARAHPPAYVVVDIYMSIL